ncbi:MAG TPA: hypothetical protein VIU43_00040 [Nitrosospira sp.]
MVLTNSTTLSAFTVDFDVSDNLTMDYSTGLTVTFATGGSIYVGTATKRRVTIGATLAVIDLHPAPPGPLLLPLNERHRCDQKNP